MQVKGPTGVRALDPSGEGHSPGGASSAGPRPQRPEHRNSDSDSRAAVQDSVRPMGTPQARVLGQGAAPSPGKKNTGNKQKSSVQSERDGGRQKQTVLSCLEIQARTHLREKTDFCLRERGGGKTAGAADRAPGPLTSQRQ